MCPMPTSQQAAANWKNGMANSTAKLTAGVNAVTESPTAKAARRIDAYLAGVQRAVQSGKTQAALNAVTVDQWKTAMLTKGVQRVASGAAAATPKVQAFMDQFLPFLAAGVQQLSSMPRGDLEQNIARATQMMRYTAGFKRTRS